MSICRRNVLDQSGGIDDIGVPQWKITLCLLCAWLMTFGALSKGVKSTGKVRPKRSSKPWELY